MARIISRTVEDELFGDDTDRHVQQLLLEHADEIASTPDLVSRGNRISLIGNGYRSTNQLTDLVRRFERVIAWVRPVDLPEIGRRYETGLSSFLLFRGSDECIERCSAIVGETDPRELELQVEPIDRDAAPELVRAAQELCVISSLPPQCGRYLRGLAGEVVTLALLDRAGKLVATGYAICDSNGGDEYRGWWFPAGIAVNPAWRGRGIGRYMNALLIDHVARHHSARVIHEAVGHTNFASQAMLSSCGLAPYTEHTALGLFASALPRAWR
jgi:GNAT superfamily N-acetyltransferase